jgi:hypothetical protein
MRCRGGSTFVSDPSRDEFEFRYERAVQAQRWNEALALLEARASAATDAGERAQLFVRAGSIALERFHHQGKAISHFEASLLLVPDQPEVRARLRVLYERRRDFESLARLADTPQEAAALRARKRWWPW